MVQIVDGAARSRIAHDLTSRLAVDAGAGSGKTSSLVERIVTLVLEKQVPMASVAAITFTEAAAAELRARIRATLTDQARHQPRLSQAAREVDDAAICTIHAFALRILTENWLEAGLPPQVEVLDPAAEHLEHKRRWREFTDGLLEDDGAAVTLKRAFAAGLRLSQLTDVAQALVDCHDRLTPEVVATLEANRQRLAAPTVDVTGLLGHLREALTHRLTCSDPQDALLGHLGSTTVEAVRRLERLDDANDETAVVSVLCTLPKLSSNRGKQENWGGAINDVREACQAAESAKEAVLSAVRRSVVADYGWRMAVWAVDGAARRRAEGRLTFHDLLVEASRALGTNAELRARVRGRYRCLLIDEYQDTDPLQAELAQLLGSPADDDDTARLFVVGDPEQSIYRFRRADVAQFEKTVTSMDARVWLTSNFRSVPEILGFVDFVFGELHDELAVDGAIGHRRLHPTRPEGSSGAGPAVAVFGGPGGEGLARDVRLQSTTDVAAVVHSIVEEGWSVGAGDAQAPACFRDIAVLLPTRTSLAMLERAFETAEIPYRLEGATLMWASQDVRDVLAVARAVSDPADAVSVLAALRTPALACGDDDLVRFHSAGGSWDPRASRSERFPDGDPVAQAMDVLKAFHDRKMWMDASSLLSSIVADLRFFELALVRRRPRDHWQRLRWLLDQVRAFDEGNGGTLRDFLEWVDLSEEAERWSSTPGPPDADDDAVRVMTVHGAKGLEFPIVLLSGLDSAAANVPPPVLFDETGVPHFSFSGAFRSEDFEALFTNERRLDAAERLRLLYVALTRAQDHLVVDLNHKVNTARALSAKLYPICELMGTELTRLEPVAADARVGILDTDTSGGADWWSEHARWLVERERLLASSALQPSWSATALAAAATASMPATPSRRPGTLAPRGAAGPDTQRRVGRAVHDALSKIELPPDGVMSERAVELARIAAVAQHLDGTVIDHVVALVRSALGSATVRSIARGRHWRELPLAAAGPEGDTVIEGFADLVGEVEDGLMVVDFKTARGGSSSSQYLGQVATYAYVLREATGRSVTRAVVAYLDEGHAEEETLEGAPLEAMMADVLRSARAADRSADVADAG